MRDQTSAATGATCRTSMRSEASARSAISISCRSRMASRWAMRPSEGGLDAFEHVRGLDDDPGRAAMDVLLHGCIIGHQPLGGHIGRAAEQIGGKAGIRCGGKERADFVGREGHSVGGTGIEGVFGKPQRRCHGLCRMAPFVDHHLMHEGGATVFRSCDNRWIPPERAGVAPAYRLRQGRAPLADRYKGLEQMSFRLPTE